MNKNNDQKLFIIAQLINALSGSALRVSEDKKIPTDQKMKLLKFIEDLKNYIKRYDPDLIKNEEFFKERKDDDSR